MTAPTIPFVGEALQCIKEHVPAPAPVPSTPQLPAFQDLRPLAEELKVDPQKILTTVVEHHEDLAKLSRIALHGVRIVGTCIADLVMIAGSFLQRAIPIAAGLFVPHTAPGALAQLAALAQSSLLEAARRIARMLAELQPLVLELATVAPGLLDAVPAALSTETQNARLPAHPPQTAINPVSTPPAVSAPPTPSAPPAPPTASEPFPEPTPAPPSPSPPPPSEPSQATGQAAANAALTQLGKPYVWGGTGQRGFDCSGLTQWAYRQAGVELPRTAAEQAIGQQVTYADLQPGDLAVWDGHVAMYIGSGQLVEAGDPVQTNPVRTTNMGMRFIGFWRPVV